MEASRCSGRTSAIKKRSPRVERFLAHLEDWQQSLTASARRSWSTTCIPSTSPRTWATSQPLPALAVQHHHAHVVAGMLEHGWLDRPVLGVAWDGTGLGTDGTIWGGEFLECTASSFRRVARLRPFRLPGGEAAIHEPWRIAVALCQQLDEPIDLAKWPGWNIEPNHIASVRQVANRPSLSPLTSSAGRLFDAAAALILGCTHADFDGEAAMRLEAAADRTAVGHYELPHCDGEPAELDWRPMFSRLLADHRRGVDAGTLAMRFHRSLARAIVRVCRRRPELPVVLTGGVFQNRLLTELVVEMWDDSPQPLGLPGIIPPNDGGLAAGQLAVAAAKGAWASCA